MNTETWILHAWKRIVPIALLGLCFGCGSGADLKDIDKGLSEDQKAVSDLVGTVADYSPSLARLRELFTADSAPSETDRKKFGEYMFGVDGEIVVTGDSATVPVSIMSYGEDSASVTQQWKAQKVGGEWKLTDAPLP